MKTFVISPSELSYVCNHCSYIKKNPRNQKTSNDCNKNKEQ